ncbi:DUF234 domain-containing protein [Methanocella arvoryzae]|uniref:DUF234 domain-containing protein n=1 Tax=Methanocella arvoryzae TaxID=1175445 RepID=UPI0000DB19D9|nr:DUF234 domain-containing protein [Methanocella arvoryzae]
MRKLERGRFTDIGRWWGYHREAGLRKEIEIDAVGLNRETGEAGFFECKWKELSQAEAWTILDDLKQKAAYVEWQNHSRKEVYGIFARKIYRKDSLREDGFIAYDLDDLQWTK